MDVVAPHGIVAPLPAMNRTNGLEHYPRGSSIELATRQQEDPFTTPRVVTPCDSVPHSQPASTSQAAISDHLRERRYFHSRRIKKGTVERFWLNQKDPREKWVTIIPLVGIFVGTVIAAFLIWDGLKSVQNYEYCPVLLEDFATGLDPGVWTKEAEVGGYGNGQFEETTTTNENVFVRDGMLWLEPTIVDEAVVENNKTVTNLTRSGLCTAVENLSSNCVIATNLTNGTIVNPVHSARINTKKGAVIRFGRVEVVARMPVGDWLWPAIWMLPVEAKYGSWPASGEIDIMETRGNNHTYGQGGNNVMSSSLHWGPNPLNDGWWRNNVKRSALHSTYAQGFHTFGLEWSEKYIFTYVDSRLYQVMYNGFTEPFWKRGQFPVANENGTALIDPWGWTGNKTTPFDRNFYLILNIAVGSTNGWFTDGKSEKPWVDANPTARYDFWKARDQWAPTWKGRNQMVVKSVKMWQQKGWNGCFSEAQKVKPH